jgi:hypothetical protein
MRALKVMLAYVGLEFVARGIVNFVQPTTFYLQADAPGYAMDAVRVLAITFLVFGLVHLGAWRVNDRRAVRLVAMASMLFAAGAAVQAATQGSASTDLWHQAGVVLGPVTLPNVGLNVLWTVIYAGLLVREARMATPRTEATARQPAAVRKVATP